MIEIDIPYYRYDILIDDGTAYLNTYCDIKVDSFRMPTSGKMKIDNLKKINDAGKLDEYAAHQAELYAKAIRLKVIKELKDGEQETAARLKNIFKAMMTKGINGYDMLIDDNSLIL